MLGFLKKQKILRLGLLIWLSLIGSINLIIKLKKIIINYKK
jgi:hypothetical protein